MVPAFQHAAKSSVETVFASRRKQKDARRSRRPDVPFSQKLETLRAACASLAVPWEEGHVDVRCRREDVASAASALAAALPARDFRKIWRFDFLDEPGMDAGGLAREAWAAVAAGIFDPAGPRWRLAAVDDATIQVRPRPKYDAAARRDYRAAGRLAAKALFDGQTVPAHLNVPLLKHLLSLPVTFADLEHVDARFDPPGGNRLRAARGAVADVPCRNVPAPRTIREAPAASPRLVSTDWTRRGRGVAATRLY